MLRGGVAIAAVAAVCSRVRACVRACSCVCPYSLRAGVAVGAGAAAVTGVAVASAEDTTYTTLLDIADRVKRIEKNLGIQDSRSVRSSWGYHYCYYWPACCGPLRCGLHRVDLSINTCICHSRANEPTHTLKYTLSFSPFLSRPSPHSHTPLSLSLFFSCAERGAWCWLPALH